MTDYWDATLDGVFDRLDDIFEAAYFTPLSIHDALAVQFQMPALAGLPIETIRQAYRIIDELSSGGPPAPERAPEFAAAFFGRVQTELPDLYQRFSTEEGNSIVDARQALSIAQTRSNDLVRTWLAGGSERIDHHRLDEIREEALSDLARRIDPLTLDDDFKWRKWLKDGPLNVYPAKVRPLVYFDAWMEYVRVVMDLDPRDDFIARWPY